MPATTSICFIMSTNAWLRPTSSMSEWYAAERGVGEVPRNCSDNSRTSPSESVATACEFPSFALPIMPAVLHFLNCPWDWKGGHLERDDNLALAVVPLFTREDSPCLQRASLRISTK